MYKNFLGFVLFLVFIEFANCQSIVFTDKISDNKITSFSNQKLILIDFWATWCGPCVAASKQLEIFQEENKSKLFVFSVSDQSESIVKKFLLKNPINLMVTLDTDKKYFDKYNVKSRPYSVLLDLKGNFVWKGHPADLNQRMFDSFYEKHKNDASFSFDNLVGFKEKIDNNDIVTTKIDFNLKKVSSQESFFEIVDNKVNFTGKLVELVCLIKKKTAFGVEIENELDYTVELECDITDWNNSDLIIDKIASKFDFQFDEIEKVQFGNELKVINKKMLWNTNEVVWDDTPVNYLIGSDNITGNDISLLEIARVLSVATNKNYIYLGNDTNVYDWEFQYIYEDLMAEELEATFGVKIIKTNASQKITKISERK